MPIFEEQCRFAEANGGHAEDGCEECESNPGAACCEHCTWELVGTIGD